MAHPTARLLTKAIVRTPGPNFAEGLTTATLGPPNLAVAQQQHEQYCRALESCGLTIIHLEPDGQHPDSTFVEDTAVLTPARAILTNPGAESRRGEVATIQEPLSRYFRTIERIEPPGTVDGGDICEAGETIFIGVSARTNEEGARQLSLHLQKDGLKTVVVDIRAMGGILHLKSGLAYLGGHQLAVIDNLFDHEAFGHYQKIRIHPAEEYAANCIHINGSLIIPDGYPRTRKAVQNLGYHVLALNMSEFQKMDGGLSCLSLRF